MKTRLLRKIRKRYSYIWEDQIVNEHYTLNLDGSKNYHIKRRVLLIAVNERKRKSEFVSHEYGAYGMIEQFIRHVIGHKTYDKFKKKKEDNRNERYYRNFKERQRRLYPHIIVRETTLLLDQPTPAA